MIGDSDIRIRVDRVVLRASMPKVNVLSYALEEILHLVSSVVE